MRQTAIILIIIVIISGCYSKNPEIKRTGLEGQALPKIDLITIDSVSHFNTASIPLGKPTILFAFEPWCPYCKAQTRSMLSQINKLKDVNICMLSTSGYNDFKIFYNKFELKKYPNVTAGIDYRNTFSSYFKSNSIPLLAIYGSDRNLKQVLDGKQYISTIKEAIGN